MFKQNKLSVCAIALASVFTTEVIAAEKINLSNQSFDQINQLVNIQSLFTQKAKNNYRLQTKSMTKAGIDRSKYQQYFNGVPVFGATIVASLFSMDVRNNFVGDFISGIANDISTTTPTISSNTALDLAMLSTKYKPR